MYRSVCSGENAFARHGRLCMYSAVLATFAVAASEQSSDAGHKAARLYLTPFPLN